MYVCVSWLYFSWATLYTGTIFFLKKHWLLSRLLVSILMLLFQVFYILVFFRDTDGFLLFSFLRYTASSLCNSIFWQPATISSRA